MPVLGGRAFDVRMFGRRVAIRQGRIDTLDWLSSVCHTAAQSGDRHNDLAMYNNDERLMAARVHAIPATVERVRDSRT